jgi:LacI family transcriptional regulator
MAGIKDVAKLAGVGLGTVSRVLNNSGYVSDATRKKVYAAIKELNFVPNEVARSFKKSATKIVGLLLPTVWHPFFSELAFYIENELSKSDYKLMLCNSEHNVEKELDYFEMLKKNQVAGIIMISYSDFLQGMEIDLPVVSIDRLISPSIPYVASDNYEGGRVAAEALIKRGCQKLAYVGGGSKVPTAVSKRKEGFVAAAEQHQVQYTVYEDVIDLGEERKLIQAFFKTHPEFDGVLTSTDMFAAALISEAEKQNLHCPSDIQVIGFDGIQTNDYFKPLLATIRQPVEGLAKTSVQLLLQMIEGQEVKHETILDISLFEGETIRPI